MPTLSYNLLVSDLDGTLLTKDKKIPPANLQKIMHFRQQGGSFTIATGRNFYEAQTYIQQLQLDLPALLCNGAVWYEPKNKQIQVLANLEKELILTALSEFQKLGISPDILICSVSSIYALSIKPATFHRLQTLNIICTPISSIAELPADPLLKIIFVATPEELEVLQSWANTTQLPVAFVQSSSRYFEMMPPNISKGIALERLAQTLNLPLVKTAVIGDHGNDLPMMNIAGMSAAVANAHPLAIQKAKVVVPSNEESGVAYFIENYLLMQSKAHES